MVVELCVARIGRLGRAVADDRARIVALAELDAVRVELVVLELERLAQLLALARRFGRVVGPCAHPLVHHVGIARVGEAERCEDRPEFLDRLVGAQDDLAADRGALRVVAVEQARARVAAQHKGELPGEVVGVLDRGVRAEPVRRRMAVDGVAGTEHAPFAVARGVPLVVTPQRGRTDRDWDGVVTDQVVSDLDRGLVVELGRRLVDVIAPDDQPLVPRADHAHETHADAADVGARLEHPIEDARAVLDLCREVGVEDDVHRAGHVHLALEREIDVLGDLATPAVGADHVLGLDRVLVAGDAVAHADGHVVLVLGQREVLGVEADVRAARGSVPDQDRLEQRLGQVADLRGAGQRVVGLARGVRAPGAHASDLIAGQRRAEYGVAHQRLRRALGLDVGLDPKVAEDLDGPLVGDVGARGVGGPRVLGDHDVIDVERRERQRGGAAGRPATDDQHVSPNGLGHSLPH